MFDARGGELLDVRQLSPEDVIRPFTTIYGGSTFGARLQTGQGASIREDNQVGDDVGIGTNAVLTDDSHPMACPRYQDCKGGAVVRRLARVGANATIPPGVEIGEGSPVGAGSVVACHVPPGAVVAGNPARVIKQVAELTCPPRWFARPDAWPPYAKPESPELG